MNAINNTAVQMLNTNVQLMGKTCENEVYSRPALLSLKEKLNIEQMSRLLNISRLG